MMTLEEYRGLPYNGAVFEVVNRPVYLAVYLAVDDVVDKAVDKAVDWAVNGAVYWAVNRAERGAFWGVSKNDDP